MRYTVLDGIWNFENRINAGPHPIPNSIFYILYSIFYILLIMQFHVPQYIDIEDKLFGPLTLKQAIYVAGGLGGAYVIFRIIPWIFISIPIIVALAVLTWALAFYPVAKLGKPFIEVLESAIKYTLGGKLYTWKKIVKEPEVGKEEVFIPSKSYGTPAVPTGKLSSTSFDLGIKGLKKDTEVKEKESWSRERIES